MLGLERLVGGLGGRAVVMRRLGDGRHFGTVRPFEAKWERSQFGNADSARFELLFERKKTGLSLDIKIWQWLVLLCVLREKKVKAEKRGRMFCFQLFPIFYIFFSFFLHIHL